MIKSIVSMILATIILIGGSMYENNFINKKFDEFQSVLKVVTEKVDNHTATENDMLALKDNWLNKKKMLHMFISHNEIREVELWLYEAISLVKNKEWHDAISKMEVLTDLIKEIPKSFILSIENLL